MRKNIASILIVLGIFLIVGFILLRPSMFSAEKLLATTIQQLQKQIKFLQQQMEDLLSKLYSYNTKGEEDIISPVLSNLEPENVTDVSGVITWGSDELSNSQVNYSVKYMRKGIVSGTLVAVNPTLTMRHEVELTALKPNTKYYYYVSSTDLSNNTSISNIHSITTLPKK